MKIKREIELSNNQILLCLFLNVLNSFENSKNQRLNILRVGNFLSVS